MFLNKIKTENPELLNAAFSLHQSGLLLPDSYVIDTDALFANAEKMVQKAEKAGIRLYFMLKQVGRNPYIAKHLIELGFAGAVVVDFKEAQVMMRHHIPIGNVGHLVQVPTTLIEQLVSYGPEVITVYSIEKAKQIGAAAIKFKKTQKILIRVYDDNDLIYNCQTAGFHIQNLKQTIDELKKIQGVKIAGVTSFPCYLYDEKEDRIKKTHNLFTVLNAVELLKEKEIEPEIINTPSASCCKTLELMRQDGGNCAEPGHGLTGTTPLHARHRMEEKTCVVYVSEISHNFGQKAYCYGGGYYRRSGVKNALVGTSLEHSETAAVIVPDLESIDYHFGLDKEFQVCDTVIMSFRFQMFVTRSDVVLVKGISKGKPEVIGVYDSLGNEKEGSVTRV